MAANTSPIFPLTPVVGIAVFNAATAVTARTVTGVTGLIQLIPASTNGVRVDAITVKSTGASASASAATNIFLWVYTGTSNAVLLDEIDLPTVTPQTTTDSAVVSKTYSTLTLPPTYTLYVSETVQSNATVFAFGGAY